MTLRTVEDTKKIVSSVTKESEIVIIGTSFIGMEVSMALIKKEPKSVTLVGMDEIPFASILGEEIGKAIMEVSCLLLHRNRWLIWQNMKEQGIKFVMKAGVEKITPSGMSDERCVVYLG